MSAITAIPSKANHASAVPQILEHISAAGQGFEQNKPGSHETLLEQARALVAALESPLETIYGFMLSEVIQIDTPLW